MHRMSFQVEQPQVQAAGGSPWFRRTLWTLFVTATLSFVLPHWAAILGTVSVKLH